MIYYVNNSAPKNGNGTKEMPFKFINDAAKIAKAGDEVLHRSGAPCCNQRHAHYCGASYNPQDKRVRFHLWVRAVLH